MADNIVEETRVAYLQSKLHMSPGLARDLLILAGGDIDIVCSASEESQRLDTMKARIIDKRIAKLEEGREDGYQIQQQASQEEA